MFWIVAAMIAFATPTAAGPLELYGRLPAVEAISLSPDGEMIAVISTDGDERVIAIKSLSDNKIVSVVRAGPVKLRAVEWVGLNHLLLTATVTSFINGAIAPRAEYATALAYDIQTGKVTRLLEDVEDGLNIIVRDPEGRIIDGKPVAFLSGVKFKSGRGQIALFQVDLETGHSHVADLGFQNTRDWVVSADGKPLAEAEYEATGGRWRLRTKSKTTWTQVSEINSPTEPPQLLGLGRDGQTILVATLEEGRTAFREIAPGGAWTEPFSVGESQSPFFDRASHRLAGFYRLEGDEERYTFFDPADQQAWETVLRAYPGERVSLVSMSDNGRKLIVLANSEALSPAYALVDLQAGKGTWLGPQYGGLKTGDVGPVRALRFKAQDGLELTGYLTLPAGREAKGLPLVVFPHGGPAGRDTPGFDWWAQAMASRGYAVLQVNFRGSAGFGWKFLSAGFGEWGRKMQTDLSDGVRHLVAEGVVDPKRVCIAGASYGGYAALAGAAFDRGVYRCAASVAGPADLRKMVAFSRNQSSVAAQRYWLRFMGVESLGDPALKAISPSEHADKIDIPVLLIHGRDDTVVALAQSNLMADALRRAGKPVELVVMPGEDHWLTSGDTRLQMLKTLVGFLEKHNPPT